MSLRTASDEVRTAKARYCRYVDTKQFDALSGLLIPSPTILIYDLADQLVASFDVRDAFVDVCRNFLQGTRSSHQVHNEELTVISNSEVHAIWSMEDNIIFPEPTDDGDTRPARLHGHGHYHEVWVREGDAWRLASTTLRRTILEVTLRR